MSANTTKTTERRKRADGVRQRGTAGAWYVKYRSATGAWVEVATEARTKTEAVRLRAELARQAERVRLGIDEALPRPMTFAQLADRCRSEVYIKRVNQPTLESRLKTHLLPEFGHRLLTEITAADIEGFLNRVKRAPCTREHLRRQMRAMFACAIRWKLYRGANPAAQVPGIKVPRRPTKFLEADEIARVLQAVPTRWRAMFALAVYAGLRKGEIAGLRWEAIDFGRRKLHVRRSYGTDTVEDTTKSGKDRYVPIAKELLPYLLAEAQHRRSGLVFPMPDGSMMPRNLKLCPILKRALKRADVVQGYVHKCRRKGCGFSEHRAEPTESRCGVCNMKLWVTPIPKALRFHDLRSTFGTHLRERSGDIGLVQRALGHSTPQITAEVYSGIRDAYAQEQVDKLTFEPACGTGVASGPDDEEGRSDAHARLAELRGESGCALQESNLRPSASETDALSS